VSLAICLRIVHTLVATINNSGHRACCRYVCAHAEAIGGLHGILSNAVVAGSLAGRLHCRDVIAVSS
jgi:hypothetical protein